MGKTVSAHEIAAEMAKTCYLPRRDGEAIASPLAPLTAQLSKECAMASGAIPVSCRRINVRPIEIQGDVAIVRLTQGRSAIIDAADAEMVGQFNWVVQRFASNNHEYAVRSTTRTTVSMHRFLTAAPKDMVVDHVNGNGLDNRRANLRVCRHQDNIRSQALSRANKLGVKGVYLMGSGFRACIKVAGKTTHLGTYATMDEAKAAYDGAASALFGEFARTK